MGKEEGIDMADTVEIDLGAITLTAPATADARSTLKGALEDAAGIERGLDERSPSEWTAQLHKARFKPDVRAIHRLWETLTRRENLSGGAMTMKELADAYAKRGHNEWA